MEDKVATQFIELAPESEVDPRRDPALPRYLIVLSGSTPGAMVPLAPGVLWLGRSEENGLPLPEPSVSRRHAGLRIDDSGMAWLVDQRSTNGTFRNGFRLPPLEPMRIEDGDRIRIGTKVVLKFACPAPEEEQFQKSMFERTVRDPLTGLYNRSYFLDQFRILAGRATGRGLGWAVIMLDIDHFKAVNDAFGHDGGDAVLREVADLIRQSTRAEDLVARYGGEEFAIALPIASADQAYQRAESLRAALADRIIRFGPRELRVTASMGVAFASDSHPRPAGCMLTTADRALYRAKDAGRNRVVRGADNRHEPPTLRAFVDR